MGKKIFESERKKGKHLFYIKSSVIRWCLECLANNLGRRFESSQGNAAEREHITANAELLALNDIFFPGAGEGSR